MNRLPVIADPPTNPPANSSSDPSTDASTNASTDRPTRPSLDGGGEEAGPLVADPARTDALRPAIEAALKTVYDPEIPVDIWELGLIYDVFVTAEGIAAIKMTLTAPACPSAQVLPAQVAGAAKSVPGVTDARVDVVWEPGWTKDRMSDLAKMQLGMW